MKTLFIAAAIAIAALKSSALVVQIPYTFAFTVLEQGITNNLGVVAAPTKYKVTNKELLVSLAQAEYFNGNYPSSSFPTGSKIIWQYDFDAQFGYFIVVDSFNAFVCDVSDIIDLSPDNNPAIFSGNSTKYAYTSVVSFDYDDTGAGGNISFYAGGVSTESVTDTIKNGVTTETRSVKYTSLAGSGYDNLGGLVITGTISSTAKFNL